MNLKILVIKDKRPGHFRQSEGIVKAIARRRGVSVSEIRDIAPPPGPGGIARLLARAGMPAPVLLRLWGIRVANVKAPDLIVSAGADTLVPNALLARLFRARNVFVGSPRGMSPDLFTAILRAAPDDPLPPRQVRVLKPSSVDPDDLDAPRPIRSAADFGGRTVALLVGGPTPQHRFVAADWDGVDRLVQASAAAGLNWQISSSPRTPAATADRLARLAASGDRIRFLDFRASSVGSLGPLLNADAVLVTEDSNSMIAEAVASRRPVVVVRPSITIEEPALALLRSEGRVGVLPMMSADAAGLTQAIAAARPLERNPLDVLYEQLVAAGAVPAKPA